MVALQTADHTPVIRTGFSDPAAWAAVRAAILAPGAEAAMFAAQVTFVDDPDLAGYTPAQILALVTDEFAGRHACLFIADETTIGSADWPVLVMDLRGNKGRTFRTVADELHGIEANLSAGNMDFSFYAEFADETGGVFRGGGPPRAVIKAGLQQALQNSPSKAMAALLKPQQPPAR
jgi:Domain of unknown function (DUF6924)